MIGGPTGAASGRARLTAVPSVAEGDVAAVRRIRAACGGVVLVTGADSAERTRLLNLVVADYCVEDIGWVAAPEHDGRPLGYDDLVPERRYPLPRHDGGVDVGPARQAIREVGRFAVLRPQFSFPPARHLLLAVDVPDANVLFGDAATVRALRDVAEWGAESRSTVAIASSQARPDLLPTDLLDRVLVVTTTECSPHAQSDAVG